MSIISMTNNHWLSTPAQHVYQWIDIWLKACPKILQAMSWQQYWPWYLHLVLHHLHHQRNHHTPIFILPTTCRAWTQWHDLVAKVANRSLRGPNTRYFFHPGSEELFYFLINVAMSLPIDWIVSSESITNIEISVTDLPSQQIWPDQGWFTQTLFYLPFPQRLTLQSKSQSHPPRRIAIYHC